MPGALGHGERTRDAAPRAAKIETCDWLDRMPAIGLAGSQGSQGLAGPPFDPGCMRTQNYLYGDVAAPGVRLQPAAFETTIPIQPSSSNPMAELKFGALRAKYGAYKLHLLALLGPVHHHNLTDLQNSEILIISPNSRHNLSELKILITSPDSRYLQSLRTRDTYNLSEPENL